MSLAKLQILSSSLRSMCVAASLAGALGILPACSSGERGVDERELATATRAQQILGGEEEAGHPAVGMLWFEGLSACTGTLIAPDVVLTAAHCFDPAHPIEGFYLGPGEAVWPLVTPEAGFTRYAVDDAVTYPSFTALEACPHQIKDLALVHLASPITDVKPVAIREAAPAGGTSCDVVGYGLHIDGDEQSAQAKRSGTSTVTASSALTVLVAAGTALAFKGDSGGPLLCGGAIVGVTSCHDYEKAPESEFYSRLDVAWIDAALSQWGSSRNAASGAAGAEPGAGEGGKPSGVTTPADNGGKSGSGAGGGKAAGASDKSADGPPVTGAGSGGCAAAPSSTTSPRALVLFALGAVVATRRRRAR